MAVISYFPSADNLKKISKLGDVITVKSLSTTSTQTQSSYYSNDNLLSTTSYTFSSIKSKITAMYLPECITIGPYTLRSDSNLKLLSLPKCTTISSYAFDHCENLSSIYLPKCTYVWQYGLAFCTALSIINLPECVSMSSDAFRGETNVYRIISLPKCQYISSMAFVSNSIHSIYAPLVSYIGYVAFGSCHFSSTSEQYTISFPECNFISSSAFQNARFDRRCTLKFPNCTEIREQAFQSAKFMAIELNECTQIGYSAFDGNIDLAEASFNKLSSIPTYAFRNTQLNYGKFPACTSIAAGAFNNCSVMYNISFPLCTTITGITTSTSATFYNCTALTTISFPQLSLLSTGYIFAGCTSLMSIYLMNSIVCTLNTTSAFRYTPITDSTYTGTFGSIYVPSSLLASYKAATNWKTISARIVGI